MTYKLRLILFIVLFYSCNRSIYKIQNKNVNDFKEIKDCTSSIFKDKLSTYILSREEDYNINYLTSEQEEEYYYFYHNANKYYDSAKKLLKCENLNSYKKRMIVYLMYGLKFNKYLDFVKYCYSAFEKKLISEKVLLSSIISYYTNEDHVIKNYNNSDVKILLNKIRNNTVITEEFRKYINDVLIGKVWEDKKEHYRQAFIQNGSKLPEGVYLLPNSREKYGG